MASSSGKDISGLEIRRREQAVWEKSGTSCEAIQAFLPSVLLFSLLDKAVLFWYNWYFFTFTAALLSDIRWESFYTAF